MSPGDQNTPIGCFEKDKKMECGCSTNLCNLFTSQDSQDSFKVHFYIQYCHNFSISFQDGIAKILGANRGLGVCLSILFENIPFLPTLPFLQNEKTKTRKECHTYVHYSNEIQSDQADTVG